MPDDVVEGDYEPSAMRAHRLMAVQRQIDDRQAAMSQADFRRGIDPDVMVVRTAVAKRFSHRARDGETYNHTLIRFHGVLAPNARLRPDIIPNVPVNANTPSVDHAEVPPPAAPAPMSWARLLKRVFEIDMEHCSQCGRTLKNLAAIEHPPVITKILAQAHPCSVCPPEHRPEQRPSIDSNWPSPPWPSLATPIPGRGPYA